MVSANTSKWAGSARSNSNNIPPLKEELYRLVLEH